MKKYNLEQNGVQEFFENQKKEESQYYDNSIKQLEKSTLTLYVKANTQKLPLEEMLLVQRQIAQAISHIIYAIRNDKFEFMAHPHLHEQLFRKRVDSIRDLRNAIEIMERKLNSRGEKYTPMSIALHQQIEEVMQSNPTFSQPKQDDVDQDSAIVRKENGDLGEKDLQILKLLQQNKTQKEIASKIGVSLSDVKGRLTLLRTKYDCSTTAGLISYCIKNGLI
jgi:DNA-binding CsgD family transcriptional regulator